MKEANDLTTLWKNTVGIYTDTDPFATQPVKKVPVMLQVAGKKPQQLFVPPANGPHVYLVVHSDTMPASFLTQDAWFLSCKKSLLGDDLWEVGTLFEKLKAVQGVHREAAKAIIQEVKTHSDRSRSEILSPVSHFKKAINEAQLEMEDGVISMPQIEDLPEPKP